ncbi:hypothetical protein J7K19_04355 [bacterium]|nr:hypothetical protein [bacterium]
MATLPSRIEVVPRVVVPLCVFGSSNPKLQAATDTIFDSSELALCQIPRSSRRKMLTVISPIDIRAPNRAAAKNHLKISSERRL